MAHVEWHEKKGGRDDEIATSGVPTPRKATTLFHFSRPRRPVDYPDVPPNAFDLTVSVGEMDFVRLFVRHVICKDLQYLEKKKL